MYKYICRTEDEKDSVLLLDNFGNAHKLMQSLFPLAIALFSCYQSPEAFHAFYQNLHQGTHLVAADFIVPIDSLNPVGDHHTVLLANFFAQTRTLMTGKNENEAREELVAEGFSAEEVERLYPSRLMPGNKPSNTILFRALTPKTLGSLIAMYEHKIFTQGIIWQINSYDQPAVELGKKVAASIYEI